MAIISERETMTWIHDNQNVHENFVHWFRQGGKNMLPV